MAVAKFESRAKFKLELSVWCTNLYVCDRYSGDTFPVCVGFSRSGHNRPWEEFGRTESLSFTLNPKWSSKLEVDYLFEEKKELKFEVYNWYKECPEFEEQALMGSVECTLGNIVAAGQYPFQGYLYPYNGHPGTSGQLFVYVERVTAFEQLVHFQFSGSNLDKKDFFSESDPFFTISRANGDGTESLVYRSEWVQDNPNPEWAMVELSSLKLCHGDWSLPLKVKVFDHNTGGDHDFIGEFSTTLDEMSQGEGFQIVTWDVINHKKKIKKGEEYENSGTVILKTIQIANGTSIVDYIAGGLKLHLVVALDFTSSNGNPKDPHSLHHLSVHTPHNPYTLTVEAVGQLLQDYDSSPEFLAFGYGGLVENRVSQCFPLNGDARHPHCHRVKGILQSYRDSLSRVSLSQPGYFVPVIDHVRSLAELRNDGNHYYVLLIVTNSGPSDLEATKRLLVNCANSLLPMSVAVVGVGKADTCDAWNLFDADRRTLSFRGIKAERDIVQVVHMSKCCIPDGGSGPDSARRWYSAPDAEDLRHCLSKEALSGIPLQVVQCMQKKGIQPNMFREDPVDVDPGRMSIRAPRPDFSNHCHLYTDDDGWADAN